MTDLRHRLLQLPDEIHAARIEAIREEERLRAAENALASAKAERYVGIAETKKRGHYHTQHLVESDPAVRRARDDRDRRAVRLSLSRAAYQRLEREYRVAVTLVRLWPDAPSCRPGTRPAESESSRRAVTDLSASAPPSPPADREPAEPEGVSIGPRPRGRNPRANRP